MPANGLGKGGAETFGRCACDEDVLALDGGLEVLSDLLARRVLR